MDGYSAIAPKKRERKELQKRQKQVRMANIYNLIKYVRCHHHAR